MTDHQIDALAPISWIAARGFAKTLTPEQRAMFYALTNGHEKDWSMEFISSEIDFLTPESERTPKVDAMLSAAVEYALGRSTTVVMTTSDAVLHHWPALLPRTQVAIVAKVDQAVKAGRAGMSCDVAYWSRISNLSASSRPTVTNTFFHGTGRPLADMDVGYGSQTSPDGVGLWLSESQADATNFARERDEGEPTVYVITTPLKNPLILRSYEEFKTTIEGLGDSSAARRALLAQGHDAIVIDRSNPPFKDDAKDVVLLTMAGTSIVDSITVSPSRSP